MLFFHQGEYIGIDSAHPEQVMSIEDRGTRLIVTYKGWEALAGSGRPNAEAPNYTATVISGYVTKVVSEFDSPRCSR